MAKDLFHEAVKNALIKEGWKITNDPLIIRIDRIKLEIDLGAERIFSAQKGGIKIAVEVKSFINPSTINDFHTALGQFLNYRLALQMTDSSRILYLAVPIDTFNGFFQERFIVSIMEEYDLKVIAYDSMVEEIIQWKN